MAGSPFELHGSTPAELQERLRIERLGQPYVVFRDDNGEQRCVVLESDTERLSVGRSPQADVALTWDPHVSRHHFFLERAADGWSVVDDGRALNRTSVNGEDVVGRRRLSDRDVITVGDTHIQFRAVAFEPGDPTLEKSDRSSVVELTPAQRRVLVALCRPLAEAHPYAAPATNEAIAEELVVGVDAVKTNMRALFEKFALQGAPRYQKRSMLVQRAFESGSISQRDYEAR